MYFRQTRIYQKALELQRLSQFVESQLPRGFGYLADQLRRATSSVILNFSEAHGKESPKERRRFFRIAKASVYEVSAIYDVAQGAKVIEKEEYETALDLCDHLGAMLYKYR